MICHGQHAKYGLRGVRMALMLCGALGFATTVSGGGIDPGTDFLKAQPGSSWDFTSNPIPADFFGPGSDPCGGEVGVVSDTTLSRPVGADFTGGRQTIPTEIVSMSLHSVAPIPVTYNGGQNPKFFDVFITLDPANPSTGQYGLEHNAGGPDGGTMFGNDSFFDVFVEIDFAEVHGPLARSLPRNDRVTLAGDVPWAHTAPPSHWHGGSGGFFPGVNPESLELVTMVFEGEQFSWHVRPAEVPEPSTLALAAFGLLGLALFGRRRKR